MEAGRVDEGFQQQQGVTEALRPVVAQAAFAQRQHARGQIQRLLLWQNQKSAVVGDQVQPIVLATKVPTDPAVACAALECGSGKAQQRQPLTTPAGEGPDRVADLRQGPQVMMRLHQRLKARLIRRSDELDNDFTEVQTGSLDDCLSRVVRPDRRRDVQS